MHPERKEERVTYRGRRVILPAASMLAICMVCACYDQERVANGRSFASGILIVRVPVASSTKVIDASYVRQVCSKYLPSGVDFSVATIAPHTPTHQHHMRLSDALLIPITVNYRERPPTYRESPPTTPDFLRNMDVAHQQIETALVDHFAKELSDDLQIRAEIVGGQQMPATVPLEVRITRTDGTALRGHLQFEGWLHGDAWHKDHPILVLGCRYIPTSDENDATEPMKQVTVVAPVFESQLLPGSLLIIRIVDFPTKGNWVRSNAVKLETE